MNINYLTSSIIRLGDLDILMMFIVTCTSFRNRLGIVGDLTFV
jgi:hypothetical protein